MCYLIDIGGYKRIAHVNYLKPNTSKRVTFGKERHYLIPREINNDVQLVVNPRKKYRDLRKRKVSYMIDEID